MRRDPKVLNTPHTRLGGLCGQKTLLWKKKNNISESEPLSDTFLNIFGFKKDPLAPTIYVRNNKIILNTYGSDGYNKYGPYKKGQSRGRMIGLEEAGWTGYTSIQL